MKHLLIISKTILFLAISAFFIQLVITTRNLEKFTEKQTIEIRNDMNNHFKNIISEISSTRKTLNTRILSLEKNSVRLIEDTRTETFARIDTIRTDFLPIRDAATETVTAYAKIPNTLDSSMKDFLDCENNALCIQNQLTDTLFSLRTATRDVAYNSDQITKNMNEITTNIVSSSTTFQEEFPKIAKNVEGITNNINRITKPKWYDRVFGYAVNGSLLYFNIKRSGR
jgi:hypothetical protein